LSARWCPRTFGQLGCCQRFLLPCMRLTSGGSIIVVAVALALVTHL
jgi:hypothetical protein